MRKIDIHCHLRSRNLQEDLRHLRRDALVYDIEQYFLISTYFPSRESGIGNYRLYHHIQHNDLFRLWVSLDFGNFFMGFNEIEELLDIDPEKIVGLKVFTGYQEIDLASEKMERMLCLARTHKKPMMFHTGYVKSQSNIMDVEDIMPVVASNPDISFVFAHLGVPYIEKTVKYLRTNPNLYTDISGLMGNEQDLQRAKNIFKSFADLNPPADQVLFGTDYPIQDIGTTIDIMNAAEWTEEEQEKVYYSNAKKLFGTDLL